MEASITEKEFSPRYPVSLVEQITEFLTNAIIEGRLENGQRLVENELHKKLAISRVPIRESFRVLEKKGLLIVIPRKGTFDRKIKPKDIQENFAIRACLERLAARLAMVHFDQKDVEKMESIFSGMKEAIKKKDFTSYRECHSEYHRTFINSCGNDTLIGILESMSIQSI